MTTTAAPELDRSHLEVQSLAREFARGEIAPHADEWNAAHHVPVEALRAMGDLGFLGVIIPEEYGGAGLDFVSEALSCEEIERGEAAFRTLISVHVGLNSLSLLRYATEEQKQRWLTPQARGEKLACFGLTEPNAGSDVAGITTRAERRGDRWVLRGTKTWVTNAPVADMLTVAAKTSGERGLANIALFLLDRGAMPGITLGKAIDKMAVRASVTGEILLEDVEVPDEHLLGGETGGVDKIGSILAEIRIMTAALSVGLARAAYDTALAYARERRAFGKPIGEHQAIGFKLADMVTSLQAAALMTYQAAARLDAGRPIGREAAMAKLFASEAAVRITDEAARVFASYGLAMEYPAQRYFRDARFLLPGGGTSEILRLVIGRELDWDRGAAFT
jgi:alkylation response protein AidB-like acyl-CoA dehydrogenase